MCLNNFIIAVITDKIRGKKIMEKKLIHGKNIYHFWKFLLPICINICIELDTS